MEVNNLRFGNPNLLLEYFNVEGQPDMAKLVNACGIKVATFSKWKTKHEVVNDVNACIEINRHNRLLKIAKEERAFLGEREYMQQENFGMNRFRFYAAYLLASYQLKCNPNDKFSDCILEGMIYDSEVYDYAVDLLIPDKIFEREKVNKSPEKLATKYRVPYAVMVKKFEKK